MSASADPLDDPVGETSEPRGTGSGRALVLVVAPFMAARLVTGLPLVLPLAVAGVGIVTIRPRLLLAALVLFIGWHAGAQLDALEPAPTRPIRNVVVELVSDPKERSGQVTAQVVSLGQRMLLSAQAASSGDLRSSAVGEQLRVSGTQQGWVPDTDWRVSRRLVGSQSATDVRLVAPAAGPTRAANEVRQLLRDGAGSLSFEQQSLFAGLVFGDDRGQGPIVADNFRAAGLGHLLAVSGQNVVFVLLLAAPAIGRISSAWIRVCVSVLVLVSFGFLTRFEPSVSRALVMAGLALLAHAIGRPASAPLVLPPAVIGLLAVDPLLAWSLAFQLSVAATLGMVVLTPRLAEMLPGPRPVVLAGAATLGAQLAVSPLLVVHFGIVSTVAVPANLLAGPAAAAVMMWGLVAGFAAGLVPPEVAELLHMPTRVLLWWIDGVAGFFARLPVGHIGARQLWGALAIVLSVRVIRWVAPPRMGIAARVGEAVAVAAIGASLIIPQPLPPGQHTLATSVELVRSSEGHDVLMVDSGARADQLLQSVRLARVGSIDLVIARDGTRTTGRLVHLLHQRFDVRSTWAPRGHEVPGARTVEPMEGMVGNLRIHDPSGANDVEVSEIR